MKKKLVKKLTFLTLAAFVFMAIILGCSKEKNDIVDDLNDTSLLKIEELHETFSIPERYLEIGDEFGRMIKYSLDYVSRNDIFALEDSEEILKLFDKSILSYYRNSHGYKSHELAELQEAINFNRQIIIKTELSDLATELSKMQLKLLNDIVLIADDFGINGFKDQIKEQVLPKIMELPDHEREVVFLCIALTTGALEVFNGVIDFNSKWSWGTFFCNVTAGGIGVIYGAAVGAFCPPCGVAVGIIVSSALSTAIC